MRRGKKTKQKCLHHTVLMPSLLQAKNMINFEVIYCWCPFYGIIQRNHSSGRGGEKSCPTLWESLYWCNREGKKKTFSESRIQRMTKFH